MENIINKIPTWFWAVAIILLLWSIMGVISFFAHTFISNEALAALPTNERALYGEYPIWTTVLFAIAVCTGLLGSLGLILKKKWAKKAFLISICAIVPQMIQNVFFTNSIDVYGVSQTVTMPVMVVVLGLFALWFSNYSVKKNWLN